MPAVASLEDLKAAQKEGVSIYAMLYALCALLYGNGAGSPGKICVEPHGQARCSILNACVGRHPGQQRMDFSAGASCGWRREHRKN